MSFDKMAAPYPRSGEAEMEVPCPWLPRGLLSLTHSVSEGIVKQAGWRGHYEIHKEGISVFLSFTK